MARIHFSKNESMAAMMRCGSSVSVHTGTREKVWSTILFLARPVHGQNDWRVLIRSGTNDQIGTKCSLRSVKNVPTCTFEGSLTQRIK